MTNAETIKSETDSSFARATEIAAMYCKGLARADYRRATAFVTDHLGFSWTIDVNPRQDGTFAERKGVSIGGHRT